MRASTKEEAKALDAAVEAGHILLENGAEIYRVEDTMKRICRHYGADDEHFFMLSNGIFATGANGEEGCEFARVQHIPVKSVELDKVIAVNQLSREVESGVYTVDEMLDKLHEIRDMKRMPYYVYVLSAGLGSGCFCYLFGGNIGECFAATVSGLAVGAFIKRAKLSQIIKNICAGFIATAICILFRGLSSDNNISHMISGAIMPLIPGMSFVNGIRDLADGDYISGSVRLLDAILVFVCAAVGVGAAVSLYNRFFGAVAL